MCTALDPASLCHRLDYTKRNPCSARRDMRQGIIGGHRRASLASACVTCVLLRRIVRKFTHARVSVLLAYESAAELSPAPRHVITFLRNSRFISSDAATYIAVMSISSRTCVAGSGAEVFLPRELPQHRVGDAADADL